jgi:hypothetical protein
VRQLSIDRRRIASLLNVGITTDRAGDSLRGT